jgi:filamentous hemagglutinin
VSYRAKRSHVSTPASGTRSTLGSAYWSRGVILTLSAAAAPAFPATLPVPCLAGSCGKNVAGFVTSGSATAQQTGKTLNINQQSSSAILNWSSFDVSADGKVVFAQPSATAVALNRIYEGNPSSILGSISANGQIYLVNPNGFVFGANSTVNVGGLLASSLSISDAVFSKGILAPGLLTGQTPTPALDAGTQQYVLNSQGNPVTGPDGKPIPVQIVVEPGAQMNAASGGRLMLASQSVQNGGSLNAPDGQVVLAAGQQVFLQASSDPKLRGIIVEVDSNGTDTAWNQLTGSLSAPRGNVTMVGLAVNQNGRISATTAVSENGSVTLVAAGGAAATPLPGGAVLLQSQGGGNLELGPQSSIDIEPELSSTATQVDQQTQFQSSVTLLGQQIVMHSGASITAPGGTVSATAVANQSLGIVDPNPNAQLRIDSGASIDVSGSTAQLSASDNIIAVQLNASQLENDPVNRNGFLHGQTVYVDSRVVGADGKSPGTAVADVSSAIAAQPHNVAYRTTAGGTVSLQSEGDVVVAQGATINVSGGQVDYSGGRVATTQLIASNGQTYDIGNAPADLTYVGLVNPTYTQTYTGWGVTSTQSTPGTGKFEPGYIQGAPAGTVQIAATNIVLNGTLLGNAYNGPYQRTSGTLNPGGQLVIGLPTPLTTNANSYADYLAPAVQFVAEAPQFIIADGTAFPGQQTLDLPVNYLTQGGFTRTSIYSNQSITLPAGLPLSLAPESSFVLSAPRIAIESSITDPSGVLSFATADSIYDPLGADPQRQGIDIGPGVVLDVRGLWTNDFLIAQGGSQPTGQTAQNGGTISLSLGGNAGELSLGNGSALEASGGAWLAANGTLTGGMGGNITLSAGGPQDALQIGSNVGLDAYGAQTAAGGQFSLTTNRIEVSEGSGWSGSGSQLVDELNAPGVLKLSSGLFSQFGFSLVNLTATGPAAEVSAASSVLSVDPNTFIQAQESNLLLSKQYAMTPSSGSIMGFSRVAVLPDYARPVESVSLSYNLSQVNSVPNAGEIIIGSGADITVDPKGSITLTSAGSLDIEGTLRAPAGVISATIDDAQLTTNVVVPNQGILLGPNAVLDAGGTSVYNLSNGSGFVLGSVLGGGSITLQTGSGGNGGGKVTTDPGSQINVAGVSAPLDVINTSGAYALQTVSTAGGTVSIGSNDTIELAGSIDAAAGSGGATRAAGGSLTISLNPGSSSVQGVRTLEIGASSAPTSIDTGTTFISASALEATGAASLTLRAGYSTTYQSGAVIQIDPGVTLSMSESLTLDTPTVAMSGGAATLSAPSVTFANSGNIATGGGTGGSGTLNVNGDFIDLVGQQIFQGVGNATFNSSGDVRLDSLFYTESIVTGQQFSGQKFVGALSVGGNLTIDAARVYPTTVSQFTLASTAPNGVITIGQTTASPGAPLSVGGSVTIAADQITSSGSLYAPFGQITLNAGSRLTLAPGSLTSVSGNGLVIPYGVTQNGTWVYQGSTISGIPARQVSLNAPYVNIFGGAKVDLSGGGDLYAYEFIPGTGGTIPALTNGQIPGLYAVLPQLEGQYAPYDPQAFASYSLCPGAGACAGASVYLSGIAGLPAGVYPLLPASYALLPGAFLVQEVAGSQGTIAPGVARALTNGTPEIAGYMTYGNTGLGDPLYSAFAVYPGSYGRQLATYQDSFASMYFSQAASQAGLPPPPLPADAGTLLLNVESGAQAASMIQGQILTQAAKGGSGADIEITAPNIEVVSTATAADSVQLSGSVLQSWDAGQLLLGGQRGSANPQCGSTICVVSDKVTVDAGVTLSAPDVEIVAGTSIDVFGTIASSSGLNASATPKTLPAATPVTLGGPPGSTPPGTTPPPSTAALLAVSDTELLVTSRTASGVSGGGTVTLESGASLKSAGAIAVEGPGAITLNGSLSAAGATVSLATGDIRFGGPPSPAGGSSSQPEGLTINSTLLSTLGQSQALQLAASGSIDVLSNTSLGATTASSTPSLGSLTLIASAIDASPGVNATFGAKSLTLEGLSDSTTATATGGTGNLTLVANTLTVSPGTTTAPGVLVLNGFGLTTAHVSGALLGTGSTGLIFGGDAVVSAAEIAGSNPTTASNGASIAPAAADLALTASNGKLSLLSSGSTISGLPVALGTQVALTAETIDDQTSIVVPSGVAILTAANTLSIGSTAVIDASGRAVAIAGQTTSSPGGAISLNSGGALSVAAGAQLGVAGGPSADAGYLSISGAGVVTLNASMSGATTGGARGGSFALDAGQLAGTFDALAAAVQTGGFSTAQSYRVNSGDLILDAGQTITANQVELVADTGNIKVGGTISAPSSDLRGSVDLFAGQNVVLLGTGQLHADSTGTRGGTIEIGTTQGQITLDPGSTISASGTQQLGTLTLRAPSVGTADVAVSSLSGTNLSGLSQVFVEPVLTTVLSTDPTSTTYLDSGTMAGIQAATATYMANAEGVISTRLAAPASTQLVIEPAVELDTAGAVTGNDPLDLSQWRFGSNATTPVDLTVRAGGSLELYNTISDGQMQGQNGAHHSIDLLSGPSSSITLVAGADLTSADPTATVAGLPADLILDAGVIVTTGTGSINLAAARNVVFNGQGATVYTTGTYATNTNVSQAIDSNRFSLTAPISGGNVNIRAGQDIDGSPVSQSVADWQTRTVSKTGDVQWGVDLNAFQQLGYNVATLGGGDLSLVAGGSLSAVSAAAADSRTVLNGQTTLIQSGGLVARAGADIDSDSQFFLADGTGRITAGGSIGEVLPASASGLPVGILLGQMNSQLTVSARGDVLLSGDINPTVLVQPLVPTKFISAFFSYGNAAALDATSVGGTLTFDNGDSNSLSTLLGQQVADQFNANTDLLPSSLRAAALTGDLVIPNGDVVMAPSAVGQLSLFAGRNLTNCAVATSCSASNFVNVILSDAPAGDYPTVADPTAEQVNVSIFNVFGALHIGDTQPVLIAAGTDITGLHLQLPKAAQISAGQDIVNLQLQGQNLASADTTLLSAGRDIIQTPGQTNVLAVGGPGAFDLFAGRNINLADSTGIQTLGRLTDPQIPDSDGASINMWAGLGVPSSVGVSDFIDKIVVPSATLQQSLITFVEQQSGSTGLSYKQAQADFLALPFVSQQPFVADTFFGQLLASGLAASTSNAGYAQGYAAIDALFPGSRTSSSSGATNPFQGDVQLPFSSIYTLQGGSISILVPSGLLNVGLANPPSGVTARPASELGIVAQGTGDVRIYASGDVDVNSSRIFTLGGGNIQIWSDEGSIDAGRGSKTAISAPPPQVVVDSSGNVSLDFSQSVAGSGIRTVVTEPGVTPGNVYLTAPVGTVDAGDAGIVSAGAIYVSAAHVIVGNGGFSAAGAEVGVPPAVSGLGAALSGASSTASSSTNVSNNSVTEGNQGQQAAAPLAQATLSWLDVFVEGFGNDTCKPEDTECIKRNAAH